MNPDRHAHGRDLDAVGVCQMPADGAEQIQRVDVGQRPLTRRKAFVTLRNIGKAPIERSDLLANDFLKDAALARFELSRQHFGSGAQACKWSSPFHGDLTQERIALGHVFELGADIGKGQHVARGAARRFAHQAESRLQQSSKVDRRTDEAARRGIERRFGGPGFLAGCVL
jgi:hypothetical protein